MHDALSTQATETAAPAKSRLAPLWQSLLASCERTEAEESERLAMWERRVLETNGHPSSVAHRNAARATLADAKARTERARARAVAS